MSKIVLKRGDNDDEAGDYCKMWIWHNHHPLFDSGMTKIKV